MEHLTATSLGSFRTVCASASSVHAVECSLRSQGFVLYNLDSDGVVDKTSFLTAVAHCFQFKLPYNQSLTSWDAALDFVWQALMERPGNKVAVLWKDVHKLIDAQLQLFLDGMEFFQGVGESAERQVTSTNTHPVLFRVVALGEGNNFPVWFLSSP